MTQIFCCCFFEIFVDLLLIVRIIYRRKYELLNNHENCIELVLNYVELLVFDIQTYVIIPKLYHVVYI